MAESKGRILIAEDDDKLREIFKTVLEKDGYEVRCVDNGKKALEAVKNEYYNLLISDIMMPVMDGYELVTKMREMGIDFPVLMITAKSSYEDMKLGFLSGSDDYMIKPVDLSEMVLRVGALLRRAQIMNERKLCIGETVLYLDSLTIKTPKEAVTLPQKEFMLLYKMASYMGHIFTRQQLMEDIWGYDNDDTHTIDVHIGRLRERFDDNPDFKIVTIRGVGYKVVRL